MRERAGHYLTRKMKKEFNNEIKRIQEELAKTKNPLAQKLIKQEIDLRKRRLRQWLINPSGKPQDPLKPVTDYSKRGRKR